MKIIIPLLVIAMYIVGLLIRDGNMDPTSMAIGKLMMNLALLIVALFFILTLIGGILQV